MAFLEKPSVHRLLRLLRPVVESAKPFVDRDQSVAVIHFEILVMEIVIVMIGIEKGFVSQHDFIESVVTLRRGECQVLQMEHDMKRV